MNELDTSRTKISFKPFLDICGAIHYFGGALYILRQKINGLIMSVRWAGRRWGGVRVGTLFVSTRSGGAMLAAYIKDILNKLPMCLISSRISPKTIVTSFKADSCPCLQKRGV